MRTPRILIRAIAGIAAIAAPGVAQVVTPILPAQGADPITQWKVPYAAGRTRDPFVAPDGRIWFVDQVANFVTVFDPKSAQFTKHDLPTRTQPHSNIVTPDGIVWLSGNGNGTIVRFDPKTGATKVIPVPLDTIARTDPHTMIYDGKGGIWFTAQNTHFVGLLDIATEKVRTIRTSPPGTRSQPYGIILDDKGHPWFDLFATNKIGTIDPKTMELKTYDVPEGAKPRRIARTSDGAIWYTDYAKCLVGRLDVTTGKTDEYPSPTGGRCGPYAMTVDDADRVWWTETLVVPNRMIAIDGKTRKVVYNFAIPGETQNAVRHMVFDPKTRQIWYGADLNYLGAVKVPPKQTM